MDRRRFLDLTIKGSALTFAGLSMPGCSASNPTIAFADRMLPAPLNGGFRDDDYWTWGSSGIVNK